MRKPLDKSGQSLVELMILLPVAFFIFLVLAQLLMMIRVAVGLQHSAARIAYQAGVGSPSQLQLMETLAIDMHSLWRWGVPDPVHSHFKEESVQGWKPYFGFGTTNDKAPQLITVQAAYQLFPHFFFGKFISGRRLIAQATLPQEIGEVDRS